MNRRSCLKAAGSTALLALASRPLVSNAAVAAGDPAAILRAGGDGLVVVMRHALAPGTYDPPGFRADDCSTQRNLSDAGRAQARRIGAWYRKRGLVPASVRSSSRCRCLDTARLAFGNAQHWAPLDSFIDDRSREPAQTAVLRAELARLADERAPGFQVWVTHQVNIVALAGNDARSGEALLLQRDKTSVVPQVLATLRID